MGITHTGQNHPQDILYDREDLEMWISFKQYQKKKSTF